MIRPAALDTPILIWGIRKHATPGQHQMIERASRLLQYLDEQGRPVIVPAVGIAEMLVRVPVEQHGPLIDRIRATMQVAPFDTMAASEYAQLHSLWKETADPAATPVSGGRDRVKADLMILGTALARNVGTLYTHDERLLTLANGRLLPLLAGRIVVTDLPALIGGQTELVSIKLPAAPAAPKPKS